MLGVMIFSFLTNFVFICCVRWQSWSDPSWPTKNGFGWVENPDPPPHLGVDWPSKIKRKGKKREVLIFYFIKLT